MCVAGRRQDVGGGGAVCLAAHVVSDHCTDRRARRMLVWGCVPVWLPIDWQDCGPVPAWLLAGWTDFGVVLTKHALGAPTPTDHVCAHVLGLCLATTLCSCDRYTSAVRACQSRALGIWQRHVPLLLPVKSFNLHPTPAVWRARACVCVCCCAVWLTGGLGCDVLCCVMLVGGKVRPRCCRPL